MSRKNYKAVHAPRGSGNPAVITITMYPSMPWRYRVDIDGVHLTDVGDEGNIAAAALRAAMRAGHYVIVGPDKVMQHIPVSLRSSV